MRYTGLVSHAAMIAAICSAAPAFAQADAPQAADADDGAAIIVTGTRTTGMKAADSPAPIQVLGNDLLKRTGQPDLMQSLAQNLPSVQAQAFGSDLSAHHLSIKLRGLSPNHTLILIDGKRRHGTANLVVSGGPYGGNAAADIGLIPQDAIDHVEVLQDGAAAQYGTDAIAGVVNFILKKADHGGSVNVTGGEYFDGGGRTYAVSGNIGIAPFEGAFLNLTVEKKKHGFSFRGDLDPRLINLPGMAKSAGATTTTDNLLAGFPDLVNVPGYPYLNRIGGDAQIKQTTVVVNGGYDFGNGLELYADGTYGHKGATAYENYRLPTVVTGPMQNGSPFPTVNGDSPFPNGFKPRETIDQEDYAITSGIRGTFGQTTFDLSTTYGKDVNEVYVDDTANAALYWDSATATSKGTLYQYNTPVRIHDGDFIASQWTTTLDLTHQLDLGLAEPLNIAAGLEYRKDTYEIVAGEVASYYNSDKPGNSKQGGAQSFFGYGPANASRNSRKNFSQYIDLSLKPVESLLIDGAVRHEHYSDFGNTTVFKVTGRYDFTPAIAIRGTVSTGFRAPTLAEGFYSGLNVGPTSIGGVLAANSPGAKLLGVNGLKPEKSTNFSGGFVFHPADKLTVTIDAYSIKIKDRIVSSSDFLGFSATATPKPIFPSVIQALIANGLTPAASLFESTSGQISISTFVNGVDTRTQGIDFSATYSSDIGDMGTIDWGLNANYNKTKVVAESLPPPGVTSSPADTVLDKYSKSTLTETTPKFRATASAFWTWNKLSVNLRESYYGAAKELNSDDNGIDTYFKSKAKFITDLEVSYQIVNPVKIAIGANNLFNTYPTKVPQSYRDAQYFYNDNGYASSVYPTFSPFGINGGYYYARATLSF
jgi:iron complex outermembrane recepter protein